MELSCKLGIQTLSRKENLSCFGVFSRIINPLLTKLVWSRRLNIGLVLSLHAKKELGQYLSILTSRLVNDAYILTELEHIFTIPQVLGMSCVSGHCQGHTQMPHLPQDSTSHVLQQSPNKKIYQNKNQFKGTKHIGYHRNWHNKMQNNKKQLL